MLLISINFRAILIEMGYQTGQHELFADNLSNNIVKEIQNKSKPQREIATSFMSCNNPICVVHMADHFACAVVLS